MSKEQVKTEYICVCDRCGHEYGGVPALTPQAAKLFARHSGWRLETGDICKACVEKEKVT